MIIYQLHKYYGEWENFHDRIIGSYLRKERAEEEKAKAEAKEKELREQSKKCQDCPFEDDESRFVNFNDLLAEYSDYCAEADLKESGDGIYCENYYTMWDESTFEIEEIEVEE